MDAKRQKIRHLSDLLRERERSKRWVVPDAAKKEAEATKFASTTRELVKTDPIRALVRLILAPRRLAEELELKDLESIVRAAIDSRIKTIRSKPEDSNQGMLFDIDGTENDRRDQD